MVLVVLAFHKYNNVRYLLHLRFTITPIFGTCCTCVSQLHKCLAHVVLAFHNYNNVRYVLHCRVTTTIMFGTFCTCVSQLQQCSVLVVLAFHNYQYKNVRYLLYLRFTIDLDSKWCFGRFAQPKGGETSLTSLILIS